MECEVPDLTFGGTHWWENMGQRTEDQSGTVGFGVCHLGMGRIHVAGLVSLREGRSRRERDR